MPNLISTTALPRFNAAIAALPGTLAGCTRAPGTGASRCATTENRRGKPGNTGDVQTACIE
ncbi:MAG: hypothetical protein ABW178_12200 [Pseudoxanthomonas sp.]